VIASGVDAATEKLEALGFRVKTEKSATYIGLGYVVSSNPSAGTRVRKGSTIVLSLV
jgi:serine/threonine-protein kinase